MYSPRRGSVCESLTYTEFQTRSNLIPNIPNGIHTHGIAQQRLTQFMIFEIVPMCLILGMPFYIVG